MFDGYSHAFGLQQTDWLIVLDFHFGHNWHARLTPKTNVNKHVLKDSNRRILQNHRFDFTQISNDSNPKVLVPFYYDRAKEDPKKIGNVSSIIQSTFSESKSKAIRPNGIVILFKSNVSFEVLLNGHGEHDHHFCLFLVRVSDQVDLTSYSKKNRKSQEESRIQEDTDVSQQDNKLLLKEPFASRLWSIIIKMDSKHLH